MLVAMSRVRVVNSILQFSSKTPGTEDGVLEPIPTFSTCYSAPFIVLHVRAAMTSCNMSFSHDLQQQSL